MQAMEPWAIAVLGAESILKENDNASIPIKSQDESGKYFKTRNAFSGRDMSLNRCKLSGGNFASEPKQKTRTKKRHTIPKMLMNF